MVELYDFCLFPRKIQTNEDVRELQNNTLTLHGLLVSLKKKIKAGVLNKLSRLYEPYK